MRIETFVRTGKRIPENIYFINFGIDSYRNRIFLDEGKLESRYVSEEDVKSGELALRARLACMEFGNDLEKLIGKKSFFGKFFSRQKLNYLIFRNEKLRRNAVRDAVKRNGGWRELMYKELGLDILTDLSNFLSNYEGLQNKK